MEGCYFKQGKKKEQPGGVALFFFCYDLKHKQLFRQSYKTTQKIVMVYLHFFFSGNVILGIHFRLSFVFTLGYSHQ
ncbi:hypothetical protein BFP75_18590 [Maribacter sp. 4G9]|nr:hypothetical protein BFP75_18590 [Maribacter sp. 4G9]